MEGEVYHMRRTEREIHDRAEFFSIMSNAKYITLAMCDGSEPYLITVNHVCDRDAEAVYFHCARAGKKVDYLNKNPRVCCEAIEDRGYVEGACDYDYRSVHFYGKAAQVSDIAEKRRALNLLIEKLEKDPESAKKEFIDQSTLANVMIFRIDIESMTGKMRVP
jgi:nitroimidazol reductase NimA-like FMN-containing flavoprotein (pyridoxamine 5'-phosphate oxidase superfamily)